MLKCLWGGIEHLLKKYNAKYFCSRDNTFFPKYIEKAADILIKKKLDTKYIFYARQEKEFDVNLLSKIRKSCCIVLSQRGRQCLAVNL